MTESATLKKALIAIRKLKQQLAEPQTATQPIAIIGMGCRFPEAQNKQAFWQLLCEGKNIVREMPEKRWQLLKDTQEFALRYRTNIKGGYLSEIQNFDAYFFGISPREALRMDPQQRMLLEVCCEALEDAGIPLESLANTKTGIFASLYASQFPYLQSVESDQDALYIPTGNAVSMAANRLSYFFDIHGPSIVFDTACSSSLVALHHACLSLQSNSCSLAMVCAANINLLPSMNIMLAKAKMLSPSGQCKTFDASADGYAQGEGVGAILLKPLSSALQDQDRIYAVIAGSAINQDGKTNGLTAPNGKQQAALLKSAYRSAACSPDNLSYVECHGTGTFLGDPIELQALGEVISPNRTSEHPCWIGSVKTNLGHLEPAAGIASIIKVALSLYHAKIPPHLHFKTPNPHIAFGKNHFRVPTQLMDWPQSEIGRIAGVSGFGFGGTNAHLVLRELTAAEKEIRPVTLSKPIPSLFVISAKDINALHQYIHQWRNFLQLNTNLDMRSLFYNLQTKRSHHFYRLAIIADTQEKLLQKLSHLKDIDSENWPITNEIFFNLTKHKLTNTIKTETQALALDFVNREKMTWPVNQTIPMLDLPTYPWQHVAYWPTLNKSEGTTVPYPYSHQSLSSPLETLQFQFRFSTQAMPEIQDTFNFLHIGYYIELISYVTQQLNHPKGFTLENLTFISPLFIPDHTIVNVQVLLEKQNINHYTFTFYSESNHQHWIKHATGDLLLQTEISQPINTNIKSSKSTKGTEQDFYNRVSAMRMPATGSIRWINQYWIENQNILCKLKTPDSANQAQAFTLKIHPGLLDACVQSFFMLLPNNLIKPFVAEKLKKLTFYGFNTTVPQLFSTLTQASNSSFQGDFTLLNNDGSLVMHCEELQMSELDQNMQLEKNPQTKTDLSQFPATEHRGIIMRFLREQLALLLTMPIEDIHDDQPLNEMGIDSLLALSFSFNINQQLGINFPAHEIQQGPRLVEMVDVIQRFVGFREERSTQPTKNPWISHRIQKPQAKIRLFCFPYGGGGASIYKDWQNHFTDTIEICPIQLPGREERLEEISLHEFDKLISELVSHLKTELALPFAFFGHSFGALIGFELARALRREKLSQPQIIFASAFPDPSVPTKSLNTLLQELSLLKIDLFQLTHSVIATLSDEILTELATIFRNNGLVEYGNLAMSKDIIKILLPIFVSDMTLVKSYRYTAEEPLACPITVFTGQWDSWVSPEDQLGWENHTRNKCEIHQLAGGHLFIKEPAIKNQVLQIINKQL